MKETNFLHSGTTRFRLEPLMSMEYTSFHPPPFPPPARRRPLRTIFIPVKNMKKTFKGLVRCLYKGVSKAV
jgi:hypothetical protein